MLSEKSLRVTLGAEDAAQVLALAAGLAALSDVGAVFALAHQELRRLLDGADAVTFAASGLTGGVSVYTTDELEGHRSQLESPESRQRAGELLRHHRHLDAVQLVNKLRSNRRLDRWIVETIGWKAVAVTPLRWEGRLAGVLVVGHHEPGRRFGPREAAVLAAVAPHLAAALGRHQQTQALVASEERYRALAEASPDAILTWDLDGTITFASPAAEELLRYGPEDLYGRCIVDLLSTEEARREAREVLAAVRAGKPVPHRFSEALICKDGGLAPVELHVATMRSSEGALGRVAVFRDVREWRALLEAERRGRRQAELLAAVGEVAATSPHLEDAVHAISLAIRAFTVADGCAVYLAEPGGDGRQLRPVAVSLPREHPAFERFVRSAAWEMAEEDYPLFLAGEPVVVEDTLADPRLERWNREFGLKSNVDYPLLVSGQLVGDISVYAVRQNVQFPAEEVATLAKAAQHVALVVEDLRLREELERRAAALAASEERYRALAEASPDAILTWDMDGTITFASPEGWRLLGYERHETPGRNVLDFLATPEARQEASDRLAAFRAGEPVPNIFSAPVKRKDGTVVLVEARIATLRRGGTAIGRVGVFRDVSEWRTVIETERQQRRRAEALAAVINATASGTDMRQTLIATCAAVTQFSVAEGCSIFLADPESRDRNLRPFATAGPPRPELVPRFLSSPAPSPESDERLARAIELGGRALVVEDIAASPQDRYWYEEFGTRCHVMYPLVTAGRLVGVMSVHSTEPRTFPAEEIETMEAVASQVAVVVDNLLLREQARLLAATDGLTAVANRRTLLERLAEEIRRSGRTGRPVGIVMLDLADFKDVNDRYGHLRGDEVLRAVAERLRSACRDVDLVGRYGGDEFVVVLPETNSVGARAAAARFVEALSGQPFPLTGTRRTVALGASVGCAVCPEDGTSARALIHVADRRLYRRRGRPVLAADA